MMQNTSKLIYTILYIEKAKGSNLIQRSNEA